MNKYFFFLLEKNLYNKKALWKLLIIKQKIIKIVYFPFKKHN